VALLPKYTIGFNDILRDMRPIPVRMAEFFEQPSTMTTISIMLCASLIFFVDLTAGYADIVGLVAWMYFRWSYKRPFFLPFRMPRHAGTVDPHNPKPGSTASGPSEGILYVGNANQPGGLDFGQEIWFTNTDARTHLLYIGTTGAGKTEGLKALVTNSLAWGSGFVYIDGKADTDLWASLYSVARRFGRDDDLFILNYMTGNSDDGSMSNSMNPFSNGSSSYLANMIVSFMPDAGGDNAMWKERAVALMFALMPALTYKRDKQGMLLDIGVVRDHIELQPIIRLSRDAALPERISGGLQGYLRTLPGYVDAAFDDEGNEKPPSPDQPMYDLQIARQQHGYLSMQFTRSLQMLADEYGYIFKAQLADVEVLDVVLNRRILVTLIPALEKAGDEAANLGKIVAASLKGMMGATLGNLVEGSWESSIGTKPTHSSSSFMTVFDEVGYYTAPGMAVMAAQARSLGFSLVFAAQDLPSMEKRIKQEARSITGNCNIKIFGRIEDPLDTKDFMEKQAGKLFSTEFTGMSVNKEAVSGSFFSNPYRDKLDAHYQLRDRMNYDALRAQREGEVHLMMGAWVAAARVFYVETEKVKALRVHRLLPIPGTNQMTATREKTMAELISRLRDAEWSAENAQPAVVTSNEIKALSHGLTLSDDPVQASILAVTALSEIPVSLQSPIATPVAEEDEFAPAIANKPAVAATAAAAGTNGGPKTTGAPSTSIAPIERVSQLPDLPPLYEGDQFAFLEVDMMPSYEDLPPEDPSEPPFILAPISGEGNFDVSVTGLPAAITGALEQGADKINKGLKGEEKAE